METPGEEEELFWRKMCEKRMWISLLLEDFFREEFYAHLQQSISSNKSRKDLGKHIKNSLHTFSPGLEVRISFPASPKVSLSSHKTAGGDDLHFFSHNKQHSNVSIPYNRCVTFHLRRSCVHLRRHSSNSVV